jgi:YggT family protein
MPIMASGGHLRPGAIEVKDGQGHARRSTMKSRVGACSRGRKSLVCCNLILRKPSMRALFDVIYIALDLYLWIVIAAAIFSWLVAFHVVNTRNQVVAMVGEFLYRITEPALRPIRNLLPNLGGIDISPVILFLIIIFIQRVIALYIYPNVY